MKKVIPNFIALIIIVSFSLSCDFVNNVNPPVAPSTTGGGTVGLDVSDSTTGSNPALRKVLIEDYTGHKCGNCPAAAIVLKNLEIANPGKIVPIAVHAGFFSTTSVAYPTNFQTTAGTAYDSQFGNSAAGNPNGLVNRVGFGTGSFIKAHTIWASEFSSETVLAPKFQILIKYKYNTGTLVLNTDIKVKSLAANTGTYKVVILLTEDKILAEQIDYTLPVGAQTVTNYEFNHVLRGSINSEWGDAIFTSGAPLNATETISKASFTLNANYVLANCHIVAYIYDAATGSPTNYEVLQVEELELK